jgi:WD40 repeat protein
MKSQWKADSEGVNRLALRPDGKQLATASHSIKLWDLSTKKLIKVRAAIDAT